MSAFDFKFSVTELAEFCCRTGHLDGSSVTGPSAQEGVLGHQWLQAKRKEELSSYNSEWPLELRELWNQHTVLLRGRVDGVIFSDETIWLEEIKTSYVEPDFLTESAVSVQVAQLKLYAAMLSLEYPEHRLTAQITWLKLPKNEQFVRPYEWTAEELRDFLINTIDRFCKWMFQVYRHRQNFQEQCKHLEFPFDQFRANQRQLSAEVYRHIRAETNFVFEAPTGIGKSVSTVFPSLKAVGEQYIEQIVFLTAKQSGRITAVDTVELFNEKGVAAKSLTLSAKDSLCFCSKESSNCMVGIEQPNGRLTDLCRYRIGFFDKLPSVLDYCFKQTKIDHSNLIAIAKKFEVCPFALSLQLIPWFDVIIGDFNYVFDPLVKLSHFENHGNKAVVLIDEAHNLIDRSRQMYSAELQEDLALRLLDSTQSSTFFKRQVNRLSSIMVTLESLYRSDLSEEWLAIEPTAEIIKQLKSSIAIILSETMSFTHDNTLSSEESSWLKQLVRMNVILELANKHHYYFIRAVSSDLLTTLHLKLLCTNASDFLQDTYRNMRSTVFFSGTLRPEYFIRKTLGIDEQTSMIQVPGIYQSTQLKVLVSRNIDTRYKVRNQYLEAIADDIYTTYKVRKGNYLVAFPSYQFLKNVQNVFEEKYPDCELLVQSHQLSADDKKSFVELFFTQNQLLGFVILGGVFTEGIDFIGDSLVGMIIVGVGLPMVNPIQEALKQDFDANGLNGFQLAYQFPGLHRVLQSAGRVIRQGTDKGIVLLLDKRFLQSQYRVHFPNFWHVESYSTCQNLKQHLHEFWEGN